MSAGGVLPTQIRIFYIRIRIRLCNTVPWCVQKTLIEKFDNLNIKVDELNETNRRLFVENVELVLPNKNISAGYKFLLEKEYWIRRKLQVSEKEDYVNTKNIPLFGKEYLLLNVATPF